MADLTLMIILWFNWAKLHHVTFLKGRETIAFVLDFTGNNFLIDIYFFNSGSLEQEEFI